MAVSFAEVVTGLDPWIHGGLASKFIACFRLFDLDDDGLVTFEQLVRTFDMLFRICSSEMFLVSQPPSTPAASSSSNSSHAKPSEYSKSQSHNAEAFTTMIYDKLGLGTQQKASLKAVRGVSIDMPLFVGFFGIITDS